MKRDPGITNLENDEKILSRTKEDYHWQYGTEIRGHQSNS